MSKKKILLVDDNKGQRVTLESILKRSGFEVVSADCGGTALIAAESEQFAAALLDIKMPDITGIDVLKELKKNQPDIIVIMMTGFAESQYAIDALNAGASAYLLKPANVEQVKAMLGHAIEHQRLIDENRAMAAALREWNEKLEVKVEERTVQLEKAHKITIKFYEELKKNFESTIEVLSIAIDQRDPLTASHSFRVTQYAIEIGHVMGLPENEIEKLRYSGLLHDLGKIGIRCEILCKDGSLTAAEYKEIQSHARGTFDLLSKFRFKDHLADIPLIAASHHERFDGNGYPGGLKGEEIPFLARILAVADVLDAITSKRHYRTAMPVSEALNVMKREATGHFDPKVVDALFKITVSTMVKIHRADHLDTLQTNDLVELESYSIEDLYRACNAAEPTSDQVTLLRRVTKYYEGPLPDRLKTLLEGRQHKAA